MNQSKILEIKKKYNNIQHHSIYFGDSYKELLNEIFNNKPFSKFGTGNIDTLKKDDIRDKLIDFYNCHYSSNLMKY